MDHETKELIHNYAKNVFKENTIDDLKEAELNYDEIEFYLNYDEQRDKEINYSIFISIVQTCIFLKSNQNYSIFDMDSFFQANSFFPN